jgi:hypothetical protein
MVFVSNRSKENDISFEWHVTSQADAQVVKKSQIFNRDSCKNLLIFSKEKLGSARVKDTNFL